VVEYLRVFRHVGFFLFLATRDVRNHHPVSPSKGVTNGSDLADHSDRVAHGRLAKVGLQPKLGLRPQWHLGSGAGGRAGAHIHGAHSPWLLTGCGCEKECAEDLYTWKIFGACGNERLPRHKRGTGSIGTESALIFLDDPAGMAPAGEEAMPTFF